MLQREEYLVRDLDTSQEITLSLYGKIQTLFDIDREFVFFMMQFCKYRAEHGTIVSHMEGRIELYKSILASDKVILYVESI